MTTQYYLYGKSTVEYCPFTGVFTWVKAYRKPSLTGLVATRAATNGYLFVKMGGKNLSAARLAYTLIHGSIPDGLEIDHINRNKLDNRIENLRTVTRAGNLQNREFRTNQCGATGVSLHKGGLYRARYKSKVKYSKTIEDATQSYLDMKSE